MPEVFAETLGQDARHEINRASRRKRNDDLDRSAALSECSARQYRQPGHEDHRKFSQHVCSFVKATAGPQAETRVYADAASIAANRHAAVDHQLGAGDEPRFVGGQEKRRVGRIHAVPHEAQRDSCLPLP